MKRPWKLPKSTFYELDLPDVITLRKNFYQDSDRHISIAASFLETAWFENIVVRDGLLFLAGGVLMYFEEEQIREFFIAVANHFPTFDFYFDSLSPASMKMAKKAVLKKGGMGMNLENGWGLKPVKSLETWDNRIRVIDAIPIHKVTKTGISLRQKIMLTFSDLLGFCSMVHMRIDGKWGTLFFSYPSSQIHSVTFFSSLEKPMPIRTIFLPLVWYFSA